MNAVNFLKLLQHLSASTASHRQSSPDNAELAREISLEVFSECVDVTGHTFRDDEATEIIKAALDAKDTANTAKLADMQDVAQMAVNALSSFVNNYPDFMQVYNVMAEEWKSEKCWTDFDETAYQKQVLSQIKGTEALAKAASLNITPQVKE